MSNVLYDEPGPRARRLSLIGTVIASLVILGLLAIAVLRLADRGQFEWELWAPLLDPGNENFALVWELLAKGLQATLVAAALALTACTGTDAGEQPRAAETPVSTPTETEATCLTRPSRLSRRSAAQAMSISPLNRTTVCAPTVRAGRRR